MDAARQNGVAFKFQENRIILLYVYKSLYCMSVCVLFSMDLNTRTNYISVDAMNEAENMITEMKNKL